MYLNEGQALFDVAKDPHRPFRVRVGNSVVQAVGTKFDVRRDPRRTQVAVAEGTVQIISATAASAATVPGRSSAQTRVTAGEAVSILGSGQVTPPESITIANIGLWQQRRLVFADSTLAEITEEFARYSRNPRLRVEGEKLRARQLSGVFDADTPEALLIYFESDQTVEVERRSDEIVIRPRSDSAPAAPEQK